jgi:DNA-binding LytR/AlgR family response regulator
MGLRCIIVDDEFPARILLQEFIDKVPGLELTGSFKSAMDALPVIQAGNVDLIFLDIQMPDITGMEFVKTLTVKPLVIFTTAYSDFAIESYRLDALDYLLKPFSFERFMQAANKAIARFTPNEPASETASAKDTDKDYILLKADHKIHRLKLKQIIYIEGLREYVTFFCENGEKIISLESLRNLENTLPASSFMRIHKSYIVNIDKIKALYGNQIKLEGVQSYIPIGKSYKEPVQKALFQL